VNWFYRLPRRDQLALLLATLALLLYGIWIALILPLRGHQLQQQQRAETAAISLQRVQAMAGDIARLQRSDAPQANAASNLPQLVDRSLRENQLSMAGFQPGREGDVRLRLESADFEHLLQWLYDIEYVHHIKVGELSITPMRQPGQVSVQVQLLDSAQ
jgi:general secretion pathway protein M